MVKVETLFCSECGMATMRKHPMASNYKNTVYNHMYKCNSCGYTKCITTHNEKADDMPKKEVDKDKRYF